MNDNQINLLKWLEDAKGIWSQTHDFNGIFQFESLIEKQQNQFLVSEIYRLVDIFLSPEKTETEMVMRAQLQIIMDNNEKKFAVIDEKLTTFATLFYSEKLEEAKVQFDNFCNDREV
mmetsp:Transcript_2787/g.4368  ORF Transcript_2787/g.4368 Transcript_2787/m.4368 type:complete len:117 (-) Transcript_2787:3349-3699(-)|eukprot:CAMPEP_0170512016 /NCGR_PEP_ID=MMETSP0208-20121228/66616_1 /TAXON_ID=197538 /ORGANISM="Strombidium inclinatum, Strain S3" /LENGTH=116 /DNA_ID=CAMNT_0010795605 /DNA_START=2492 /DNA_END=2842 /DNA_ORIENTATION=-